MVELFNEDKVPKLTENEVLRSTSKSPTPNETNPAPRMGDVIKKRIIGSSLQIGGGNQALYANEQGIWLGAKNFEDAPFSVNMIGESKVGNISMPAGGYIRAGQTDYNTGIGFWLGRDSGGVSKLSIGNPAANRMTWNGTVLSIIGAISSSSISSSTITGTTITAGTITGTTITGGIITGTIFQTHSGPEQGIKMQVSDYENIAHGYMEFWSDAGDSSIFYMHKTTAAMYLEGAPGGFIAETEIYAYDFITLSKVAIIDNKSALESLKNIKEWKKEDGSIDYKKHYACIERKTKDGKKEYGLSLEIRISEMEKMIYELNQKIITK